MPATISHAYSATTPDLAPTDPFYGEVRSSQWNDAHAVTLSATAGTEIFGAFSNDPAFNVTFSTNAGGQVVASANVTAAPSPVNVTGANGSSVNAQTIAFSNSNGITLGVSTAANGATVTGSYTVPSTAGLISRINVSAGTTSNNLSALTFADSNGISFGLNASTLTASHNGLTSQSNQAVSAANGSYAFQTLSFSNANGISFGTSAGSAVTGSYTVPTVTNSSWTVSDNATSATVGRLAFTQSNGLTLSLSTSNNGNHTVIGSYTVPTISSWTVSDAATSATVGRLAFTQSNGLTLSLSTSNNGNHTVIGSYTVPTVPAQLSVGNSNLGNTAGDTGVFTGRVVLVGSNNITLSGSSNGGSQTISIIGGAGGGGFTGGVSTGGNTSGNTGTQTGQFILVGSNNITMSVGTAAGGAQTVTVSGPTLTQYFSKTNTTFNGANISGSITHDTNGLQLSMSVAAPGAAAENNNHNLLGANTAGNTTASGSTIGLSGINLTLSGTNNSVINISAPATSSMVGTNGINISTNGSTISIYPATIDVYMNLAAAQGSGSAAMTNGSYSNGTINLFPLNPAPELFPGVMTVDRFGMLWSCNHTNTTQSTQAFSSTFAMGIYTQNNATQISRLYSGTWTTQGAANANNSSLLGGVRWITLAASNWDTQPTLTQGNYWGAMFALTGGTSVGASSVGPVVVRAGVTGGLSGIFGSASASANSNAVRFPFDGYLSVSSNALPNNIALSDVIHTGSGYGQMIPMIAALGSAKSGGFGYW